MSKKVIHLLCSDADRAALQPVLDALQAKGLRVSGEVPEKNDLVLAVLSEGFYADDGKTKALLDLVAAGAENVLPLQLDSASIPDVLKNALYSRNIIPASERDAAHTAERIADALPKRKSKLPLILTTAALVLVAVVGLLIWQATLSRETVPTMAEPEIVIPSAYGLTQEDLDKIAMVSFISDQFYYFTAEEMENGDFPLPVTHHMEDDGMHWDSTEDGRRLSMTRYSQEDLAFLKLLPNLRHLEMVLVDSETLPDLSELSALDTVMLADCTVSDLSCLAGNKLQYIGIYRCPVKNYSALSDCPELKECEIEFEFQEQADLSAFSPPSLEWAEFRHGPDLQELNLSGLASCPKLRILRLQYGLPIRDLSFLSQTSALEELTLEELPALADISSVGTLERLKNLYIGYCPRISDYSPIAGCTALEQIHLQCDNNPNAVRDASFLAELPKLRDIGLYSCNLYNMDFLESIAARQSSISLGFAGDIRDYSGLASVTHYEYLHVNPRNWDFSAVLPYIQDATIDHLMLYECNGVDLSTLPAVTHDLSIRYGNLTSLTGLKDIGIDRLELWDMQYLTTLDGLESLDHLIDGMLELHITGCPRLRDFSALDGAYLEYLDLLGTYTVPDLGAFRTKVLRLESIEGLTELSCLDALNGDEGINLELVGLDALTELTPLWRLHGDKLTVPPQVEEEAAALIEEGNFKEYAVEYPDGNWQPSDAEMILLSLDELDTLPASLLRRVKRLCIAGDQLIDYDRYDIWEDWEHRDENGNPALQLHDRETDAVTPLTPGVITDLEKLSALTGLRVLYLYGQPLQSLDGIQALSSLEEFSAKGCTALSDVSALFALPELRSVDLKCTQVDSIQGVQNLWGLRSLNISNTKVDDLTPLAECDFSAAEDDNGFDLDCNELDLSEEDFAAMGHIRRFQGLAFTDADPAIWIPALSDCEIQYFGAAGDLHSNEDLSSFAADHPELRELFLGWAEDITDLTPLLELENLERVSVNRDMREAVASLDGQSYGFELEIQG